MLALPHLAALWLVLGTNPPPEPACLAVDEDGTTWSICFDPARGLELGLGASSRLADSQGALDGTGTAFTLRGGILLRTSRESRSRQGSLWFFEQRILGFTAEPAPALRAVTVTAYEGTYRRHVREGFILIPTGRRPTRLPFPFDVALHLRVGHIERRVFEGPGATFEIARAALLLDPLRQSSGRVRLGIGPALGYTLRTDSVDVAHELSPFTSGMLDFTAETTDGWWSVRLGAVAGWVTIPGQGSFFRASGQAHLDRLLIAIYDQPVWLSLGVRATERDAGVYRRSEIQGSLTLVMRAFQ